MPECLYLSIWNIKLKPIFILKSVRMGHHHFWSSRNASLYSPGPGVRSVAWRPNDRVGMQGCSPTHSPDCNPSLPLPPPPWYQQRFPWTDDDRTHWRIRRDHDFEWTTSGNKTLRNLTYKSHYTHAIEFNQCKTTLTFRLMKIQWRFFRIH